MDPGVLGAWIGAGSAVAVALGSAAVALSSAASTRRHERELETFKAASARAQRQETAQEAAEQVVETFRRPLLAAAVELKRRLGNIRSNNFLGYLNHGPQRSEVAMLSTLYRFAFYLGWREMMSRRLTYLSYKDTDRTKEIMHLLEDVAQKLSSSGIDVMDGEPRLMLWKDEQRAIGGLMIKSDANLTVLGFEEFLELYEARFGRWFGSFAEDLTSPGIAQGQRLREVADSLGRLIEGLDVEEFYDGRA